MRVTRFALLPFAFSTLALAATVQAQTTSATTTATTPPGGGDSLVTTTTNEEQTVRGQTVFTKVCVECHTKSDMTGPDFKVKWHTRPVFDLFEVIRTTMPDNNPGTLTREEYVDVTTYLLRLNGAQTGGMPLAHADTTGMRKMKIEIQVPPPNLDSLKAKTDTIKPKTDTLSKRLPTGQLLRQRTLRQR